MAELSKTYEPHSIESHWYRTWNDAGHFVPQGDATPFCLMLPPPNVTGSLHMGHALEASLMDCLIRYHRMKGAKTHWQVGTDHAGIATQMVVERQLNAAGKTRIEIGREAFVESVWTWKQQSGDTIASQFKRMGISADWTRERFTMDEGLSRAVREVFVRLYDENLIYRGQRLVNWDCVLNTAVSDLEVDMVEEDTFLWHLRYPIANQPGQYLIVATTRPETMLGDTAVAVNPQDERYQALIGQFVELPLTDRKIPIIADDYVDASFGTGCVKITPAHDFNDYEVGKRHELPMINVFNMDGTLNSEAPAAYQKLDRSVARERIVADLTELGLVEKIEPYRTKRPRGDRSGSILEPMMTSQWFVKIEPLAKPAIEAVENGTIEFSPPHWANTYYAWMRDIKDWCISRQLWWGHRIPAWYDDKGNIYVADNEAAVREKYKLAADFPLRQDEDVLDTWFSSALWPFSTLGWPEKTPDFETFYPTSVLISGFDIIFFWVARMIMMGLKFTGQVPFKRVYIHGLICDSKGQKMSKSKGNVLDPLDLIQGIDLESLVAKRTAGLMQPQMAKQIERDTRKEFPEGIPSFGTDALRLMFCSLPSSQRHVQFDLNRVNGYRNFCNKLWNSARYVLMNTEGHAYPAVAECDFSLADRYILSLLQKTVQSVRESLDHFRYDFATQSLYEFVWNHFCDWYLELSKPQLQDASVRIQNATRYTLVTVLETVLRLLHPFAPFITEEIWQRVADITHPALGSIMIMAYPEVDAGRIDETAEKDMAWLQSVIVALRNIRGEMGISPKVALPVLIKHADEATVNRFKQYSVFMNKMANIGEMTFLTPEAALPATASALIENVELHVPLADFIDKEAELARIAKLLTKNMQELQKISQKLSDSHYTERAPEAVVLKDKARVEELTALVSGLQAQQARLEAM
jgi:valyl-tRNA synthetase